MTQPTVKRGTTSVIIQTMALDTSSPVGGGKTGLVYNSSGLTCYYKRELGNASVAVTLATMTLGTWATGGFKEVDATNMPGVYDFGVPDAAVGSADASKWVTFYFRGASGAVFPPVMIPLVAYDAQDAVRLGLTALPNAAAEAAGGLFTRGTGAGQINQAANGMIDTNPVRLANVQQSLTDLKDFADTGYDPATHKVQGVVLTDTTTTTTTATNLTNAPTSGDFTATMKTSLNAATPASVVGAVGSVTGNVGGNVTGSVGSVVGAVGSVTGSVGGNVTGSVGSVVGAVGSVTGNVGGNVTGSVASVSGNVSGSVGSLATQAKADVNAEVLDVLNVDTFAEPGAVPVASASLVAKIGWLTILARNARTQTSTTQTIKADNGSTTVGTSAVSDNGSTLSVSEWS